MLFSFDSKIQMCIYVFVLVTCMYHCTYTRQVLWIRINIKRLFSVIFYPTGTWVETQYLRSNWIKTNFLGFCRYTKWICICFSLFIKFDVIPWKETVEYIYTKRSKMYFLQNSRLSPEVAIAMDCLRSNQSLASQKYIKKRKSYHFRVQIYEQIH